MRDLFKCYWFTSFSIYEGTKVKTAGYHLFQTDRLAHPKVAHREIIDYLVRTYGVRESDIVLTALNKI